MKRVAAVRLPMAVAVTLLATDHPASAVGQQAQAPSIVAAGERFLELLDDSARAKATYPFDDAERFNWHFVPRERNGLPFKAMTLEQRRTAHALMQRSLSARGYLKAVGVTQLERLLYALSNESAFRDPERYFVTVFGTPATAAPWGWRLEGHHLSLNFTLDGGEMAATPAFLGANPHEVRSGHLMGWRLLGVEEDLGRQLVRSLSPEQLRRALIAAEAPRDIITGNAREAVLERFEGIAASELTDAQRELLMELVAQYVGNAAPPAPRSQLDRLGASGWDKLYFAWAGSLDPGRGHYYRVHGPSILIEYDNTQDDANHAHTVWRDLERDFGGDLLRRHYEESGHHH